MPRGERLLAATVGLAASCALSTGLVAVEQSTEGVPAPVRASVPTYGPFGDEPDRRVRPAHPCTSCQGRTIAAPTSQTPAAASAAPGGHLVHVRPAVPTPDASRTAGPLPRPSVAAPAQRPRTRAASQPQPQPLLVERFSGRDGAFAREQDFWGQQDGGIDQNATWFATSGRMQRLAGAGQSASEVFRMWTRRTDLAFPRVEMDISFDGWSGGTEPWNGVNLWLNRRLCLPEPDCHVLTDGEDSGYALDFLNRDGSLTILKKVPGTTPDGTYHELAARTWQPVPGRTYRFGGQVVNEGGGAARLQVLVDGHVLLEAVDDGSLGGPVLTGGRIGLRGDNADFSVDNLVVTPGA